MVIRFYSKVMLIVLRYGMGLVRSAFTLAFLLLALVWMTASIVYFRRHREGRFVLGRMVYAASDHSFRDWHGEKIAFTPMQQQLMELFINAADRKLSKAVICETLGQETRCKRNALHTYPSFEAYCQ